jgi:hypothetical protein
VQTPETQLVEPCAFAQAVPQLPHDCASFVRLASQPLAASLSQSPDIPATQLGWQIPSEHCVVPKEVVHSRPQPPQLMSSLDVATSQPLAGLPSQSVYPIEQLI